MKLLLICLLMCSLIYAQVGTITGRVVDENGEPALGAAVEVLELEQIGTNVMDMDSGRFTIPNVPHGSYSVRIGSIGFQTVHISCVQVSDVPLDLMVELDFVPITSGGEFNPDFHDSSDWYERAKYDSAQFANGAIYICGYSYNLPVRYGVIEGSVIGESCEAAKLKSIQLDGHRQKFELRGTDWRVSAVQPGTYRLVAKATGCKPIVLDSFVVEAGEVYRIPALFEHTN